MTPQTSCQVRDEVHWNTDGAAVFTGPQYFHSRSAHVTSACVRVLVCVNAVCVFVSYHEQLQQQHQQKQQGLGRWEFWVVVMPRPPPVPLTADVSLRPPPMASSPPRSAGIGPVYCRDTQTDAVVTCWSEWWKTYSFRFFT